MIQLITGIIASALHVITGPDHLAAVTPLAIESKKRSWSVGLFWGIGHVAGMLLIGLLFILFKEFIPIEAISAYSEQIVGIVLVGIGVWAIIKAFRSRVATHRHPHYHAEPEPHVHIHAHHHEHENLHQHSHKKVVKQNNLTALGVGTLHGFAGVSHLVLMLPTLALPSMTESVLYLTGFAAGTLAAMIIYTVILGFIGHRSSSMKSPKTFMVVRLIGGTIAVVIGVFWFLSIL